MVFGSDEFLTQSWDNLSVAPDASALSARYQAILKERSLAWVAQHQLVQVLGSGTQGVVFLSSRQGAENFCFPVAVKVYSPERYLDSRSYEEATLYMGRVAMRVAHIQQDNLVNVQNWTEHHGIRCMVMEWIEGHDLRYLVSSATHNLLRTEVSEERWQYLNQVVVTAGPAQCRLKAGIASP